MKRIVLLFAVMISVGLSAFAQKNKVQTAWNYLKYDDLQRAAEAIEEAAVHEQTSNSAKTWYYRGLVYQRSYKHEKYGNLAPNALEMASESFRKALQLEPDYEYAPEIKLALQQVATQLYGQGVDHFTAKNYDQALTSFENILQIAPDDEQATLNAAYSADRFGDKNKAKVYYGKLIDKNFKESRIYIFQSALLKEQGDTSAAIAVVQKGRQLFPSDNNLIIEELNFYLYRGDDLKAMEVMDAAIQSDPMNPSLYFARGTVYDRMGKKDDAANSYQKAIELKADYFDAYYNLGAMYFNEAAELANKANDIKSNTEYAKAKDKFDAKFRQAVPYLEKALELNDGDQATISSLKQIYLRLNEKAKFDVLNQKK